MINLKLSEAPYKYDLRRRQHQDLVTYLYAKNKTKHVNLYAGGWMRIHRYQTEKSNPPVINGWIHNTAVYSNLVFPPNFDVQFVRVPVLKFL
jgi:hypothetical protein